MARLLLKLTGSALYYILYYFLFSVCTRLVVIFIRVLSISPPAFLHFQNKLNQHNRPPYRCCKLAPSSKTSTLRLAALSHLRSLLQQRTFSLSYSSGTMCTWVTKTNSCRRRNPPCRKDCSTRNEPEYCARVAPYGPMCPPDMCGKSEGEYDTPCASCWVYDEVKKFEDSQRMPPPSPPPPSSSRPEHSSRGLPNGQSNGYHHR